VIYVMKTQPARVAIYLPGPQPKRAFIQLVHELFHLPEESIRNIKLSMPGGKSPSAACYEQLPRLL
jgi:hypothetical protein